MADKTKLISGMNSPSDQRKTRLWFAVSFVLLLTLVSLLTVLDHYQLAEINHTLILLLQWLFMAFLVVYAIKKKSLTTWILISMLLGAEFGHDFPENIARAVYEGQVLQIVVFSIIFGIATALVREKFKRPVINFTEALSKVMFKFTSTVMYFAPFAVFAAIAYSIGHMGLDIFVNLFKLLATLYISLIILLLGVFFPIMLIFKIPVRKFIRTISEPVALAFAITSSESALPLAMERLEEFGIPRKIVAFVMPTGYSFNLDVTTLYLSLATIFVAQISGIHLTLDKHLLIIFTLMLTSKGVAGVPRASLVILMATAASFGLPIWPVYIILGIDELMDMARTSVNVIGNCLATMVIAKWEKESPPVKSEDFQ